MSGLVVSGAAFTFAAILVLQGCGGGNDISTTTTTTTTAKPSASPTTTSTTPDVTPYPLPKCVELKSFAFVINETSGTVTPQCIPSKTPGAYYTNTSYRKWSCFKSTSEMSRWNVKEAQKQGFEGACVFDEYSSRTTPGDVQDCREISPHHPQACAPGPDNFWGACWSHDSEKWECISKDDKTNIADVAKGDCKAHVQADGSDFYEGACRFGNEAQKIYKCDTVRSYSEDWKIGDGDSCCFSLDKSVAWSCLDEHESRNNHCEWMLLPDGSERFFNGGCVFPKNKDYASALNASNLTEVGGHFFIV